MTLQRGNPTPSCPLSTCVTSLTTRTKSGRVRRVIQGDGDCRANFGPIQSPGRAKGVLSPVTGIAHPGRLARPTRVLETVLPWGLRRATAALSLSRRLWKQTKPDQWLTIYKVGPCADEEANHEDALGSAAAGRHCRPARGCPACDRGKLRLCQVLQFFAARLRRSVLLQFLPAAMPHQLPVGVRYSPGETVAHVLPDRQGNGQQKRLQDLLPRGVQDLLQAVLRNVLQRSARAVLPSGAGNLLEGMPQHCLQALLHDNHEGSLPDLQQAGLRDLLQGMPLQGLQADPRDLLERGLHHRV